MSVHFAKPCLKSHANDYSGNIYWKVRKDYIDVLLYLRPVMWPATSIASVHPVRHLTEITPATCEAN